MKLDKLTEATMLALRGKLNESTNSVLDKNEIAEFLKNAIKELTTTDYTCTWYDLDKDLAIFVGWTDGYDPEDEDYIHAENDPSYVIAAKIASTHEYMKTDLDWLVQPYYEDGEVWDTEITLNNNSNFIEDADWFIKSYKDIREALDRGELLLENKKQEVKGSSKTYTCIEDRQYGDFCVGATMTAEEWGKTAMGWADSDGWSDPEEPLLKNFKTEQDCINFIDDMWEITIVPSDDPRAKEFLSEARSHKEDNERVAPRIAKYSGERVFGELDNVPKRARYNKSKDTNWGYFNDEEANTYENGTDSIMQYKTYKTDAESERALARYHNANAQQRDNMASDIVRDKKLNRAKRNLNNHENKKETEARSHKEDNEKAAPRTVKNALGNDVETREMVDVSNPAVGNNSYKNKKGSQYWGTTHSEYASKRNKSGQKNEYGRDIYLAPFKNTGDWTIKADRMEPATSTARYQYNKGQAENDKERVDYYTRELKRVRSPYKKAIAQSQIDSFEKSRKEYDDKAHQIYQDMKDKQNKEREKIANKSIETKKVTEATTDVNKVVDKYKRAYHKDLDLKTVPCVIARDKMLSGWGGAEGKTHYQVVLCADSNEAYNIAHNMQSKAKQEQLANVRVSYGVKLPSRASVAYCVGRDASAWNMGDNWYERYDKKSENKSIKIENVQGNNQGICPKCGSMITNYGEIFWDDDGIGQVFDCTNPECKAHGIEYYNTTFDYIEIED